MLPLDHLQRHQIETPIIQHSVPLDDQNDEKTGERERERQETVDHPNGLPQKHHRPNRIRTSHSETNEAETEE